MLKRKINLNPRNRNFNVKFVTRNTPQNFVWQVTRIQFIWRSSHTNVPGTVIISNWKISILAYLNSGFITLTFLKSLSIPSLSETLLARNWLKKNDEFDLKWIGGMKIGPKVYGKQESVKSQDFSPGRKIRSKMVPVNKKILKVPEIEN